MIDRILPTFW